MGKRTKEHRKKVQKRNARIKQMQTSFNKKLQEMFTSKLEEYQKEIDQKNNVEENNNKQE